jgi:hypothetical protein
MQVTIEMPDDIAGELTEKNGEGLRRAVLEAVALEGYRSGRLTHPQVGQLVGLDYRFDVDAFLKEHGVFLDYAPEDLERDRETLRKLGV